MAALTSSQEQILFEASEAACDLVRNGMNYDEDAISWCAHKVEGYDPAMFEGNRDSGSFLVDDYWETVFHSAAELWRAYQRCKQVYDNEPEIVEILRLATPQATPLDFISETYWDQSCFESAFYFGHYRSQFLPDKRPEGGQFWDATGPDGLPFSPESIRQRMPKLLELHVGFFSLRPRRQHNRRDHVPPWLEIVKETQRATGKVPPSVRKVGPRVPHEDARLKRLSSTTRKVLNLLSEGVEVNAICQRTGMSADNVRQISSRYPDLWKS